MSKKKKIIIIVSSIIALLGIIVGLFLFMLSPVGKDENVIFVVEVGSSKVEIIDSLKDANLIKSKFAAYGYVFLNNPNLQAGKYMLNRNMSVGDIIKKITSGDVYRETVKLTFIEGERLLTYVDQMVNVFGFVKEDIIKTINDKEYLNSLIDKYWFLTDEILDEEIYYPLEGYLFPATYEFFKDSSIKMVVEKMLDAMNVKLKSYEKYLKDFNYSVHEVITMASIIEKEALTTSDRQKVSQVINLRLDKNSALGMDVTAAYGAQVPLNDKKALIKALNKINGYNTRYRLKKGLPVGAICSPSLNSIDAAFNPSETNYEWFVADMDTGIVYFTDSYSEFLVLKEKYGG